MKLVLTLLGVVLLVIAAVYVLVPADQLPGFFPGHEAGVTRVHLKHGVVSGVPASCCWAPASGWDGGERERARRAHRRRREPDVAPGDESRAYPDPERPPAWRPHRLHLGRRSWTWREIDAEVSALAAALAARGIGKGDRILVHSKNCDEMFWSMFAAFRLGAVWVPTNFRLMPDEVAYLATASGAKAFLCHGDFPDHAAAVKAASPALAFIWRIGEGDVRRDVACATRSRRMPAPSRQRRGRARRSLLVLLHLGHHGPLQGGGADPRPDGLRRHQSSRRPDARHHGERRLAGGGAAVARRRRASADADRARRADHPAADREVRHRRGVPADRDAIASATSSPCRPF